MTTVLAELSEALAKNVESAGPSLVRIEGRRRLPASGIVWSEDGVVVTANHVVKRDENIVVGLADDDVVVVPLAHDPVLCILLPRERDIERPGFPGAHRLAGADDRAGKRPSLPIDTALTAAELAAAAYLECHSQAADLSEMLKNRLREIHARTKEEVFTPMVMAPP